MSVRVSGPCAHCARRVICHHQYAPQEVQTAPDSTELDRREGEEDQQKIN